MKSSRGGSSSGRFWVSRVLRFFREADDFPLRLSKGVKSLPSSGVTGFILARAATSPSRIRSKSLACSAGPRASLASNAFIKPAWESFNCMPSIFSFFKTSKARAINSTSASVEAAPISSAPHCQFSLVFFPVGSKIKTLAT